ncbi:alpha-glucosidase/alpha-galactosidase [Mucisphaera sp.]|uniref:family 4 glycosyl hydrolase n=1 Tax=Mucisphaera sp. TaxID=2913024 RepID=UPI003D09E10E
MASDQAKGGHEGHVKRAEGVRGFAGEVGRPLNVTFLGAGSMFCPVLCRDVMAIPGGSGGEFRLVDVDEARLALMKRVIGLLIEQMGQSGTWTVRAETDRRRALPGTDYAVCCVEVSGRACVDTDYDIPFRYGVDQCIGDTMGPGGLFKGLRTIPVFLEILRDMAELCPGAPMLNYTNPMSMMVLAAGRAVPEVPVVGLCHSVQGTSHLLADYAGVPYEEMDWACAGINHLAWFTKLEHRGEDLYQKVLMARFEREVGEGIAEAEAGLARFDAADDTKGEEVERGYRHDDLVRKDMCLHFGAFITESSGHLSEYLPYYRKSEAGRKLLRLGYHGGSRFYATNWPSWRAASDGYRERMLRGEETFDLERSWEYASWIIEAMEKDVPYRIHGNVMNRPLGGSGEAGKLITNLPGDGAVEVACLVDGNGVQPTRYGALPAVMGHVCASNMGFFDLAATAAIERSRQAATEALYLDPLCQAVCTPGEIAEMAGEMFETQAAYLPGYA